MKEPSIHTPIRGLFWGARLPPSQSASCRKKSPPGLNPSPFGFTGLSCSKQRKLELGNCGNVTLCVPAYLFPIPPLVKSSWNWLWGEFRQYRNYQMLQIRTWFIAFFFLILFRINYFWLCWDFVAAWGFSLVGGNGGYSLLWCLGFSLQWPLLLQSTGSSRAGFSSCGTWAYLPHSMWNLPRPGIETMSPALAGRFSFS